MVIRGEGDEREVDERGDGDEVMRGVIVMRGRWW